MDIKIENISIIKNEDCYICNECGKEYSKNGITSHYWRSHGNGKNHDPNKGFKNKVFKRVAWNKGLTKETSESLKKAGETYKNKIKTGEITSSMLGRKHSFETIEKLKKNAGGYRKGSGRGKSGWYKGYWCDSSWELAYTIYNIDHNIAFERNCEFFEYEYNGKVKKYLPDYIVNDVYVEIKGEVTLQWKAKLEQFKHKIIVIGKNEIKKYIEYASNTYGSDFIKLYDGYVKPEKQQTKWQVERKLEIERKINIIRNCDVDFSKFGWVTKVAELVNMKSQKINEFFKKHLPDLYEICFKKNAG